MSQEKSPNSVVEGDSGLIFPYDHFVVRYIPELGFAAVDEGGNFLFEVFPFDNGPDYPSDGLIRIREKGKIGYTDMEGTIVIPPAFDCAYPFQDGVAFVGWDCILQQQGEHSVWKGGRWGVISKTGTILIEPLDFGILTFDILNLKLTLLRTFSDDIVTETCWRKLDRLSIFLEGTGRGLFVDLSTRKTGKLLLTYLYLPWQDLILRNNLDHNAQIPTEQLVTVTPKSIVYLAGMAPLLSGGEIDTLGKLSEMMRGLLEQEANQTMIRKADGFSTPSGLRVISMVEFPNYVEVTVATPGSGIVSADSVRMEFPRKMILLHQVPDYGAVRSQWIKPGPPDDYPDVGAGSEPAPTTDPLPRLVDQYILYRDSAIRHPGKWVDGNLLLGARDKEYRPSAAELMLMEIGERIGQVISETSPEDLTAVLKKIKDCPEKIEYIRFFFIHYDVMGSGRFFYIDGMEKVSLKL